MRLRADNPVAFTSWRQAALACLAISVALNAAAFLVRAHFVATSGSYAATTGFEEFCLYNIWKVAHGWSLYEWPQHEPYLLTSYNAAFYEVYAAWARWWKADGAQLVACVRGLTPLFALAGMLLNIHLLGRLVPAGRGLRAWRWGLPFLAWFGSSFTGWTTITARPDIAAAALAFAGVAAGLRANESRGARMWVASSLLFFAAWSFKQSVIWIFAGTMLHLLLARRWRELAALAAPFGLLAGAALAWSGEAYRYNLFTVPRVYRWLPWQSVRLLAQAIGLNLFFWVLGGGALRAFLVAGRKRCVGLADTAVLDERWGMIAIATVPPLAMGAVQLALRGSSTNNILEGFLMIALLGSGWWMRRLTRDARWPGLAVGAALLLAMALVPAGQLALAARNVPYAEIRGVSVGNLIKLSPAQLAQRRQFAAWLDTLPKPLWIRDAMLQMPWFATANRYPAFLLDYEFETDAARAGVLMDGGFSALIRRRRFACLLLRPDDWLFQVARRAGYVEAPLPRGFEPFASEYGIDRPAPMVLWREAPRNRPQGPAGATEGGDK